MLYSYECHGGSSGLQEYRFMLKHGEETIGICYVESNAREIVRLLNAGTMAEESLAAAKAVLETINKGMPVLVQQGARSPAFRAAADQTAEAFRRLRTAVDRAEGREDADGKVVND